MYPYTSLPKPLRPAEFYVLLALNQNEHHAYAIKSIVRNMSLGSVDISDSKISAVILKLANSALVDEVGPRQTGKSSQPRMHYAITEHGLIRLQEELQRLGHAQKIAKEAGLLENPIPTDIQRLLLDTHLAADAAAEST